MMESYYQLNKKLLVDQLPIIATYQEIKKLLDIPEIETSVGKVKPLPYITRMETNR